MKVNSPVQANLMLGRLLTLALLTGSLVLTACSASDEEVATTTGGTPPEENQTSPKTDHTTVEEKNKERIERRAISSEEAPEAIGPYSQAIAAGDLIFLSGQLPADPESGEIDQNDDISAQTEQVLENLEAVLRAEDLAADDIVATNVYMADLDEFDAMNETYGQFFSEDPPARATVEVARVPQDAKVEIEATAVRSRDH